MSSPLRALMGAETILPRWRDLLTQDEGRGKIEPISQKALNAHFAWTSKGNL